MKKSLLIVAALVGITGMASAVTINNTALVSSGLNGNNAYLWGITIAVPTGQSIATAEIDFTSVKLTVANSSGHGYLYTDILNAKTAGTTAVADNDAAGDYWATKYSGANIVALGTQYFASVGTTKTWSYVLDASQIASLNAFLIAGGGTFDIGLDPDCHYNVGGLSFKYTLTSTNTHTVPDVSETVLLMLLGLAGLEVCRRQFVSAKAKA